MHVGHNDIAMCTFYYIRRGCGDGDARMWPGRVCHAHYKMARCKVHVPNTRITVTFKRHKNIAWHHVAHSQKGVSNLSHLNMSERQTTTLSGAGLIVKLL